MSPPALSSPEDLACWRSHMFPACIGVLFAVAGLLGYNAGLPPYGIPIGLVMATLGWWIIRTSAATDSDER